MPYNAMDLFLQNQGPVTGDPRRPMSVTLLNEQADEEDRLDTADRDAYYQQEQQQGGLFRNMDTVGHASMDSMRKGQLKQSPWRPYLQALKNAGVGSVQTAGSGGMDFSARSYQPAAPGLHYGGDPTGTSKQSAHQGFFDTQTPALQGLQKSYQPNNKVYTYAHPEGMTPEEELYAKSQGRR